jgi:two-component system, chemotaxis family, protein-glutamate methylesterase/glutaminase
MGAVQKRDIVVIGTSAGGVGALKTMLPHLPKDLPAAVFIVIHLAPTHRTFLHQILANRCPLPVELATNMRAIQRGHVYIAPPDHHLLLGEEHMRVVRGPKENGHRPAVDPLFRTAAHVYGPRVIGVVLTGALDCGSSGLAIIKSRGGAAIVQDPADAEVPDMPRHALQNVPVDHITPLAALPEVLTKLVHSPAPPRPPVAEPRKDERLVEEQRGGEARTASGFTCPACAGALWEDTEARLEVFRCRIGHRYSLPTLALEESRGVETALWTAVRALAENAAVARHVAQRARERGDEQIRGTFEGRAREAEQQALTIRGLIEKLEPDLEPIE